MRKQAAKKKLAVSVAGDDSRCALKVLHAYDDTMKAQRDIP
jgi:hypothetical protein